MTDKEIKRYFNTSALGFFAYAIMIQILAVVAVILIQWLFPDFASGAMYYSMMISVIPSMLFLYFLFRNSNIVSLPNNIPEASFSLPVFFHYFVIFCGVQWISAIFTMPFIFLFENLGLDLSYSEMAAKGGALDNIPMLIYTVLFAPVVEELVFRGIFYKRFKAFGAFFTAFASSLFFALIHSNFLQFIPAFMMGFVLFSIRDRYGLRYSILLHLTNNALAIVVNNLGGSRLWVLSAYGLILLAGTVYALVNLVKNRRNLSSFLPGEEEQKNLRLFFRSPVLWFDILILVVLAIVIMMNPGAGAGDMATTV